MLEMQRATEAAYSTIANGIVISSMLKRSVWNWITELEQDTGYLVFYYKKHVIAHCIHKKFIWNHSIMNALAQTNRNNMIPVNRFDFPYSCVTGNLIWNPLNHHRSFIFEKGDLWIVLMQIITKWTVGHIQLLKKK